MLRTEGRGLDARCS